MIWETAFLQRKRSLKKNYRFIEKACLAIPYNSLPITEAHIARTAKCRTERAWIILMKLTLDGTLDSTEGIYFYNKRPGFRQYWHGHMTLRVLLYHLLIEYAWARNYENRRFIDDELLNFIYGYLGVCEANFKTAINRIYRIARFDKQLPLSREFQTRLKKYFKKWEMAKRGGRVKNKWWDYMASAKHLEILKSKP